jgi:hypothetical protein
MNNREKATVIWLAIALGAGLRQREIRSALREVVKCFAQPKIVGPLLAFAGWTVGLVVLAHLVGLWESDVRNDTVLWFITVGVAILFSLREVTEDGFVRKSARRALAVTALVEGFANLEVFSLAVELVLLPVLALLGALAVVSESKKEYAPVRRLVSGLLSIFGVCILLYVAGRLVADFEAGHTLRALALPVWLTIGSLPFVYAFGLIAEYEQAFLRIDFHTNDPSHRRRAKRGLLRTAHVRATELTGFTGHWISDLTSTRSDVEARAVLRRWQMIWRSEEREMRIGAARTYMHEWLTQDSAALAAIHANTLRRAWDRLDGEQRATLKSEGLRLAPRTLVKEFAALPD